MTTVERALVHGGHVDARYVYGGGINGNLYILEARRSIISMMGTFKLAQ